jgi:hypothetical protein
MGQWQERWARAHTIITRPQPVYQSELLINDTHLLLADKGTICTDLRSDESPL